MFVSHLQSHDYLWISEAFFLAQTLNKQLQDCEEQLAEFDKKNMGLKSWTAPLIQSSGL